MKLKAKKVIIFSIIAFIILILLFLLIYCLSWHRVVNKFHKEEIRSVVKVTRNENGEEEEKILENDKNSLFLEKVSTLKYQRYYNVFAIKSSIFDSVKYVITYDNYIVKLSEHHLIVIHNGVKDEEINFNYIKPTSVIDEINKLFE